MPEPKRRAKLSTEMAGAFHGATLRQRLRLNRTQVRIVPDTSIDTRGHFQRSTNTVRIRRSELDRGSREVQGVLRHELGHADLFAAGVRSSTARHHQILSRTGLGVSDTSSAIATGRLKNLDPGKRRLRQLRKSRRKRSRTRRLTQAVSKATRRASARKAAHT